MPPLYSYAVFNDLLNGAFGWFMRAVERPQPYQQPTLLIRQSGIMQRLDGMSLQAFDALQFPRNQRRRG